MIYARDDIAGFYRLGLDLRLVSLDAPIEWADSEITRLTVADEPLIDLSLSAGQPLDQIATAVRRLAEAPDYSPGAVRLIGALMWNRIISGELKTAEAANVLYGLSRKTPNAMLVFGDIIFWIDDLFEPYNGGPDEGDRRVRKLLSMFSQEQLPPT